MPAQTTIRDARPDDLPAIFAIYNEQVLHGTATFDTEPRVAGRDDAWLRERDRDRHPLLVAEREGAVVGWAALAPWSSRGAYARRAEASVYVDARWRGQGLGRQLVTALVDRGRRVGLGVLIGRIAEGNPASVALLRSLGFGRIGTQRRCGEKFGRILDVELMDLHLDGG